MMNAALRGKPDAGNPHVRFDEGEVVSEKPRRGSLLYKNARTIRQLIAATAAVFLGFGAVAEDIEINVEAGQTVTRDDVISGEGKLVKKGLGTLVLTAANTYTGGTELQAGVIEIRHHQALGTGTVEVYGSTEQLNQLNFNTDGKEANKIVNAITVKSASSLAYPAFFFQNNTYLTNGTITAEANLYMATAWADDPSRADSPTVKLFAPVIAQTGACIGGAPHCMISFEEKLDTPLLDCCYVSGGQASNGGNAGCFRLRKSNNRIDKISIDQTSIRCEGSSVCTNTLVEWSNVAEHLKDDVGRFEINGNQSIGDIITPEIVKGGEGCIVTNVGTKAKTFAVIGCPVARDCYARFDGLINFQYLSTLKSAEAYFTFKNRRHLMKGEMYNNRHRIVIGEGASIPYVTKISNSTSKKFNVTSEEEDVLDGVRTVAIGSTTYTFNETGAQSLSKGLNVALQRSTGTLTLNGTSPLQVKSYYNTDLKRYYPAGEYTPGRTDTTYKFNYDTTKEGGLTGTVLVWGNNVNGTRTGWTNMVWEGASTASSNVNDLANWEELPQYVTFKVPAAWVKFAAVDGYASLTNDVHWGGLTFTADTTNFTLKSEENDPTINLYDNGLIIEKGEGDEALQTLRSFTIEPKLDFQKAQTVTVPTNDTLTLEQPILGETLTKAGDGRLVIGGEIPAAITISGGALAFASGATLPADDTMVLDIAEGAKIVVPQDSVLRVKTLTYAGEPVAVGFYQSGESVPFIEGEGKVRVNESTATPTPETITWKGNGSFETASNWDPEEVNLGWDDKYTTIFAKDDVETTGAAVGAAHRLIGMQFSKSLGNFTLSSGADSAALTIGSDSIVFESGKDETVERTITVEPPVTLGDWSAAVPKKDTIAFTGGLTMGKLTMDSDGTMALSGNSDINGKSTINTGTLIVNGTLSGSDLLVFKQYASSPKHQIVLNGASVLKTLYWGDQSSTGEYYIRSFAPIGTTNYLATIQDKGTSITYFEYGRTFIITNCPAYAKHYFRPYGTAADGPTVLIVNKITQGYRAGDGTLEIAAGVDCSLGRGNGTGLTSRQLYVLASGVVRFLDDNLYAESTAKADALHAKFVVAGTAYLGSTHQRFSMMNGAGTISGDEGSELEILCGTNNAVFTGCLAGKVSLTMSGAFTNRLNGVSTTAGEITVNSGMQTVEADAQLRNLSVVNVNGGTLKVTAADAFSSENTALVVTGGMIELDEGAVMNVASATVGGASVQNGTYTAANPGDFDGYITGEGRIRIGPRAGTMFIIK